MRYLIISNAGQILVCIRTKPVLLLCLIQGFMISLGGAAAHFPGAPLGFQSGAAQAYTAAVNTYFLTAGLHFPRRAIEHPA